MKVSRSDFRADAGKVFRRYGDQGLGNYRWYCCPAGVIEVSDLPAEWGLLWVTDSGWVREMKKPSDRYMTHEVSANDRRVLYSLLSRAVAGGSFESLCGPYAKLRVPERPSV